MTLQLSLDTPSLVALFPEGTQARVDLQSAAINEFVSRHLKASISRSTVQEELEAALDQIKIDISAAEDKIVKAALGDIGIRKDYYGGVLLNDHVKAVIKEQTEQYVKDFVTETIKEQVTLATSNLQGVIANNCSVVVKGLVDAEISAAVKAKVAEVSKALLG